MVKKIQTENFWVGKKVLITGHTGFKGSWLCLLLKRLGADVYGYALEPPTNPSLFADARIHECITSYIGDIRDYEKVLATIKKVKPEIIIHMAAQALVLRSYHDPVQTYSTNVMGTVNVLEAVRHVPGIKAVINVTTDKCYENHEWLWGYREYEPMGGYDPYSNSKACSELVTSAFRSSFFNAEEYSKHGVAVASARAGNVIGGGDWAEDRLIPDFVKAVSKGKKLTVRNPAAIRPWQHVLEPLSGYLKLAEKLYADGVKYAEAWNFGPEDKDARSVEWIITALCSYWGKDASFRMDKNTGPHEATYLKLDCSKAKNELGWQPQWDIETALRNIVDWNKAYLSGQNIQKVTEAQISEYYNHLL
ncbi:MAG TPA: CDP-glucose 4,6-dehydratase [Bacteroidales bacterium]|nr:CDP-glucose 4,6-dehydratase [Bacteroidales bacterium]